MDINQLSAQLAQLVAGGGGEAAARGALAGQTQDLIKALQASNYQTDVATLSGGGALGIQSLDTAMKTVVQENEHFVLFNQLRKPKATNIVDEYTRQTGIGGFLGGSVNSQMGVVRSATGEYQREVGYVKFLMTLRQVGYILTLGNNIADAEAVEEMNGAKQLLTDAEYLLFHGNAAASPLQFDGIFTQLEAEVNAGRMSSDHIIDLQGAKLDSVEAMTKVSAAVAAYGSWGKVTDIYMPNSVQIDLNMGLDPAFRWTNGNGNTPVIGAHVEGIRLQNGVLKTHMDTFIHDYQHPMASPFEVTYSAEAAALSALNPTSVTANASSSDASSQFTSSRAGNYYYAVASIDKDGKGFSQVVKTTSTTVAAGKKVVLTISASGAGTESGYAIYRSRQDGTNNTNDFRLVKIIPVTAGGTTTFTDLNRDIPGTTQVPLLNMGQGADAIDWRQFNPMTKIPLPFGIGGIPVYSWFQFLFGYLRITKPKHHGLIKNILPASATWRPHTGE